MKIYKVTMTTDTGECLYFTKEVDAVQFVSRMRQWWIDIQSPLLSSLYVLHKANWVFQIQEIEDEEGVE